MLTLMDFPIHIDTVSMDLSILYFKWSHVKILLYFSLNIVFILTISADPNEMPQRGISSGSSLFAKVPVNWYPE